MVKLKRKLQRTQAELQERSREVEQLRIALEGASNWQTKAPELLSLGRTIAHMPPFKAAAADAAIGASRTPLLSPAPQDLASVAGIGTVYEQRLYRAGIGSYWELAHLSDAEFVDVLELGDADQAAVDLPAVRLDARRLADATDSVGVIWAGETPDDFEPIKGIGKVYEQRLYEAGVRTYRALAAMTPAQLAQICSPRSGAKPDYASWIAQAQAMI
ncbi:MAG: hypothetical protein IPK16_04205 [Anaerolineales bacterium]|nr:hypothetical protein [Anaerolineales bacterium]